MNNGSPIKFPNADGEPTNATFTSDWLSTGNAKDMQLVINALGTGTPTYTFKLQGSAEVEECDRANAGVAGAAPTEIDITLPVGSVHGTGGFTVPTAAAVTVAWDGTAELKMGINVEIPFPRMRLVGTKTGGTGSASVLFKIKGHVRGR